MSSEETYKGKKIVIKSEKGKITLQIGGNKILIGKDEETKKYFSDQLPGLTFDTPSELAKAIIDGQKEEGVLDRHYLLVTTLIGIGVAGGNLCLLYFMNSASIANGIGLAMVGIITFFGMMIASSVFEEHRHEHAPNSKKVGTQSQNISTAAEKMVAKVVAGKGIMRKAIASSLIIVYIIVIGLYVENGELSEPLATTEIPESVGQETPAADTTESSSKLTNYVSFAALQLIQGESNASESEPEEEEQSETEAQEEEETRRPIPRSLLEHFTTVVTAIIVFYFGTDIATAWFKSKYGSSSATS